MDLYTSIEECKNAKLTWYDHATYKANYHVLESWEEIEKNLLDTYIAPKSDESKAEPIDPDGKYEKMLNNLLISSARGLSIRPNLQSKSPRVGAFYKQTKEAVRNSLWYMFHKYGNGYFARIRDGQLVEFCYLWNPNWSNTLANKLIVDPKYAKKYARSDKKKWPILGSMVRVYEKRYQHYAMDFYYSECKWLLQQIAQDLPNCDFIIANKDNLVIKRDLTEPCEEVVGDEHAPLESQFKFREYCPIFSFCWNERYADIPLPTPDDVQRIYQLYAPEKCNNLYLPLSSVPWGEKNPSAVFRGSYTGSSANIERNPRLHVAMLNHKWRFDSAYNEKNPIDGVRYLDAGLSSKGGFTRGRKELNDKYIRFVDDNYWQYLLVEPLTHEQQSHYKYVMYIEGNVAAYRAAYLFSMGSVIIWIQSPKYHLWFEPYLEDNVNCVFVKHDLSDLAEKITWLKQHDTEAEKIALAGHALYNDLLSKEAIEAYTIQAITAACS